MSDIGGGKKASTLMIIKNIDFLLSVTTIMKTVIGAGILSLPLTISRLGFGLALIVFAIIISADQFTCVLLLKSKNSIGSSYIAHIGMK